MSVREKKSNHGFQKGHMLWKGGKNKNVVYVRNRERKYAQRTRKAVLEALGGECVKCGYKDERALQIDHINGGGGKERSDRKFSGVFNLHVLRSFISKENKYQLLCANCNWIKRSENREHRK